MTKKRKRQTNRAILEDFSKEISSENTNMKLIINPDDEMSMSDAISELIEPFKKDTFDYNSFRNLITYGCLAWNAANLPVKEQDDVINKILATVHSNIQDRLELLGLMTELIDRKKKIFPNGSRMIIDFKVTEQGRDFHIAVASTLETGKTKE